MEKYATMISLLVDAEAKYTDLYRLQKQLFISDYGVDPEKPGVGHMYIPTEKAMTQEVCERMAYGNSEKSYEIAGNLDKLILEIFSQWGHAEKALPFFALSSKGLLDKDPRYAMYDTERIGYLTAICYLGRKLDLLAKLKNDLIAEAAGPSSKTLSEPPRPQEADTPVFEVSYDEVRMELKINGSPICKCYDGSALDKAFCAIMEAPGQKVKTAGNLRSWIRNINIPDSIRKLIFTTSNSGLSMRTKLYQSILDEAKVPVEDISSLLQYLRENAN